MGYRARQWQRLRRPRTVGREREPVPRGTYRPQPLRPSEQDATHPLHCMPCRRSRPRRPAIPQTPEQRPAPPIRSPQPVQSLQRESPKHPPCCVPAMPGLGACPMHALRRRRTVCPFPSESPAQHANCSTWNILQRSNCNAALQCMQLHAIHAVVQLRTIHIMSNRSRGTPTTPSPTTPQEARMA